MKRILLVCRKARDLPRVVAEATRAAEQALPTDAELAVVQEELDALLEAFHQRRLVAVAVPRTEPRDLN